MTHTRIDILTALALAALVGLVLIQVNWLHGAFNVAKEDFDRRASAALSTLRERIDPGDPLALRIDALTNRHQAAFTQDPAYVAETMHQLEAKLIEELARQGIQHAATMALFIANDAGLYYGDALDEGSTHQVELYRNCPGCGLTIGVSFPDVNAAFYLPQISGLLLLSVVLMTVLVFCFGYTLHALHRQKKLSDLKSDFINNMTHEYKTPLFTISVAAQVLKDAPGIKSQPDLVGYVARIEKAGRRLKEHTERILEMALLESGRAERDIRATDIHTLIHQIAQTFGPLLEKEDGTLRLDLKAQDPILRCDPTHLSHALYNLLDNARKYTHAAPAIEVRTRDHTEALVIEVIDQGIGISKGQHPHIFEKFYRVPSGDLHDVKGFGLGLTFVKEVVDAHGGTIRVESRLKEGSRFEMTLPRTRS